MFNSRCKSVSLALLCAILLAGCGSGGAKLITPEERSSLKTLILMPTKEGVYEDEPSNKYELGKARTSVRTLKAFANMTSEGNRESTSTAAGYLRRCLKETYGGKKFAFERFRTLFSELISREKSINLLLASEAEQKQFFGLTRDERAQYIKSRNANAVLIVDAFHMVGIAADGSERSISVQAFTGLCFVIDNYLSGKPIYHPNTQFTGVVTLKGNSYCGRYIANFERAVDQQTRQLYNAILGAK